MSAAKRLFICFMIFAIVIVGAYCAMERTHGGRESEPQRSTQAGCANKNVEGAKDQADSGQQNDPSTLSEASAPTGLECVLHFKSPSGAPISRPVTYCIEDEFKLKQTLSVPSGKFVSCTLREGKYRISMMAEGCDGKMHETNAVEVEFNTDYREKSFYLIVEDGCLPQLEDV